ncbi:shikimate kinase [Methylomarinovum caldicuralii]|uniref:Shikimate kinase n=1 Tax=Methylomarinovum caldicuralii TaxID=438856 RepID=A0AAU9CC08_9GAMM|nr:shikimate kinase AroK [Methylomarinovum caldicuralii]BCX82084.1 shikimate kinase [Methylomarinovum caldicuralii]
MNSQFSNIYLVGPMGAGKTTVGRLLARELEKQFYDSDREIETRTGVDIPTIFEYEGEEGFRRREAEVLHDLVALEDIVLATGGGIILREENRRLLRDHGFVVYLYCPVAKQVERTARDTHRPLLQTADPKKRLTELLAVRAPLYESIADYTINTGECASRQAVKKIIQAYRNS